MTATRLDIESGALSANGTVTGNLPVNGGVSVYVSGSTIGSGNVQVQLFDGTNWVNEGSTITTINSRVHIVAWAKQIRATLAGATSPSLTITFIYNDNGQ